MDLRQLKTFVHVAELGSLSKAAERLSIAQPALSRQMRLLEDELKAPLFTRHGRGMALTASGALLFERAVEILRAIETTRSDVAADAGIVKGRVALGTPPTVGEAFAVRLVERFLAVHPGVKVRIVPAFSGYLMDWLQRGEIDLALMYEPDQRVPLKLEPLIAEPLYAVSLPRGGRRAARPLALAKALEGRLILPGPQHGLRKLIERIASRLDRSLNVVVEADSLELMKELVARGLGTTILPQASVAHEVALGRLAATSLVRPGLERKIVVAEALGRQSSRAARLFREALVAEVVAMVQSRQWHATVLR
jgi:LysR family transcriptional regulator, nitrogen assimilation regulatory protein